MPVVIVIGVGSVPAAVMRLERVMCPANTGVRARHDNPLPGESESPNIRGMRISNPRLDGRRTCARGSRRFVDRLRLGKIILDARIAFDARHVRPGRQRVGDLSRAFHQDGINDIERLMLDFAFAQPLQDWPLGPLGLFRRV